MHFEHKLIRFGNDCFSLHIVKVRPNWRSVFKHLPVITFRNELVQKSYWTADLNSIQSGRGFPFSLRKS